MSSNSTHFYRPESIFKKEFNVSKTVAFCPALKLEIAPEMVLFEEVVGVGVLVGVVEGRGVVDGYVEGYDDGVGLGVPETYGVGIGVGPVTVEMAK